MGIGIWGDGPKITPITGKDKVNRAYKSEETGGVQSRSDKITISEGAKDYNMVTKLLKDVPDVREDKVKDFSQKIDTGEYSVKDNDVADKLLEYLQHDNT